MHDRWHEILRGPVGEHANWCILPENGWGAVIAYWAGPGCVRPHDVPWQTRTVTEICGSGELESRRTVPMSADDYASIIASVNSYLVDVGLPASPATWWEVALPEGMSEKHLMDRLNRAVEQRSSAMSGVEVAREAAAILGDEIRLIFAEP